MIHSSYMLMIPATDRMSKSFTKPPIFMSRFFIKPLT